MVHTVPGKMEYRPVHSGELSDLEILQQGNECQELVFYRHIEGGGAPSAEKGQRAARRHLQ